jgi:hypothetical protein
MSEAVSSIIARLPLSTMTSVDARFFGHLSTIETPNALTRAVLSAILNFP